jgi:hypothetical protein
MKIFTREELRTLTASAQAPFVSLYMPTHRVATENQQDRTRLKNLIRQAQESLQTYGLRPAEAESFLEPVTNLLGTISFWKDKRDGLARYISPIPAAHRVRAPGGGGPPFSSQAAPGLSGGQ